MTTDSPWAHRALQHTRHLAERIGPRGSPTPEEKPAADYIHIQMQKLGLKDVQVQSFRAPRSGWLPIAIAFSAAVWGSFLCWAGYYLTQTKIIGGLIGVGLSLFAAWIFFCEIAFKNNPLRRRLPRDPSFNVIGHVPASGQAKHRVVLLGHIDTHPASRVFKSSRRARFFSIVMGLSFFSSIAGAIMFALGGFDLWSWGFVFAGVCSALQGGGILTAILADQGEFSPGANVNASGVGSVLALAERLRQWPLPQTEVWTLCAGSHEVGGEGLRAFLDRYHDDLRDAWLIGFEGVGVGDRLIYFTHEGLFRRPIQPAMLDLLQRTTQARPDLMPQPRATTRRNTVVAPAIWRGLNSVCLSLYAEREGVPYWRSGDDHATHIQTASLTKVHEFAWELLQQIDEEQTG